MHRWSIPLVVQVGHSGAIKECVWQCTAQFKYYGHILLMTHNYFQETRKIVIIHLGNKGIIKRYIGLDKETFMVIGVVHIEENRSPAVIDSLDT